MALNIYSKEGILKLTISPDDSSTHQHGIMEDNVLNLSFTLPEYVMLDVNDYTEFDGLRFWMIESYVPQQKSTIEWTYSPKFYGTESLIKRGLCLKLVDNEMQPVFSLTAPAREHMTLIVDNINRVMNTTDFKVGEVISTENLVIDYNSTYLHEALSQLAEAAGTEWWVDQVMTFNLTRCEHGEEITLGYRNGLTKLERTTADNVKFFTRLYPLGSTRNITHSEYGYTRLQLPAGQKYVEQHVEQYGVIEHSEESAFSDIYPRRTGEVSSVRSEKKTGQDGNPFKIYYFKDKDIPFDPNDYEIGELVKHIVFQSGELNGREFEVNYDSKKKEFEIITQFPYDDGMQIPNDILTPKLGDKYILWNIKMPKSYITAAEQEFKEAVDEYMSEYNLDKSVYKAPTDYIDIKNRNIKLVIGQHIRLESEQFFPVSGYRSSRITRVTRKINLPTQADIEISDVLSKGKITTLENSVNEIKTVIEATRAGVPDIIKSWESTPPADSNLFSALRSMYEFLNKNKDGEVVQGYVRFLKQLFIGTDVIDSMTAGAGVLIDNGRVQMDRAEIRNSLSVLEVIFNRQSAMESDYLFTEAGTVESVEDLGNGTYRLPIRKQSEVDFTALAENDCIYGIVNNLATGGTDYQTSWLRVVSVNTISNNITAVMYPDVEVPGGKNYPPEPLMILTHRGNPINQDRQAYWYISSREKCICMLDGVTKPILEESNYAVIIGKLKHLSIFDNLPINYLHSYIYCRGLVIQDMFKKSINGVIVKTEVPRGQWSSETALGDNPYRNTDTEYHTVYHFGCKWMCLTDKTTQAPKWNATGWALIEGNNELSLEFSSDNGYMFFAGKVDTIITPFVYWGYNDISSDVLANDWQWTRDSGNLTEDNAWSIAHANNGRILHLTNEDMPSNWGRVKKVKFTCTAFVRDGETSINNIENSIIL